MPDYRDLGYDSFFRRQLPTNLNQQSAVGYDSMQEGSQNDEYSLDDQAVTTRKIRDFAVTNAKISNIKWNKGKGGELILGGEDDVNGVLSLLDQNKVERILMNNDGIYIKDGKLVIENRDGQTTIDSLGMVSNRNFNSTGNYTTLGTNQDITNTTADLSGSSFTFSLPRSAFVLILADIQCRISASGSPASNVSGFAFLYINVDGTDQGGNIYMSGEYDSVNHDHYGTYLTAPTSMHAYKNLGAGSHTIKLRATHTNTTNSLLNIYHYKFTYFVLGT